MSAMTGRLAAGIRRRHCSTASATGLENIRKAILPVMSVSCRPMHSVGTTTPTRPDVNQHRSLKRPAGATVAENSSTRRNRERRRLPARPCGVSMSSLRSSERLMAKRWSSGLPCAVRSQGRSSSISKSGCVSSEPCSHQIKAINYLYLQRSSRSPYGAAPLTPGIEKPSCFQRSHDGENPDHHRGCHRGDSGNLRQDRY
jgi:hypothetical protein